MRIGVDHTYIVSTSDRLTASMVSPPRDGPGICGWCRSWVEQDPRSSDLTAGCENCREVQEILGIDPLPCAVISLYKKPSDLRDWLTHYKGRGDADDPYDPSSESLVASIVGRFIIELGDQLELRAGGFDAIVVVPSTSRPTPHPLEVVLRSLELDVPVVELLQRGHGDLGFRRPTADGFKMNGNHPPKRVLLVDDVYTTGSRLNSAAVALTRAGHCVSAALVIARRINVDYHKDAEALWHDAAKRPFDWRSSPWMPT